ncbi:similar to Saccharomyces cerevisiae YJR074W MOG1 Conserved nuclear protein that interacts with GTP-Gsp1p [Maudiozyma saulgeensis]|uniref:Similar to Saccharomyces cerevisiae YJR074W MOG1 Conserved nuclear protein that interacts with GTP-Gsp1p n=1 Tax=Maudiozyma saulgeensis TaxID=1789683 RepID=A0A1X7R4U5_9SACH|nr:similar to Saccharomyces cerevisiae YJR074W MOG1 Conserved nuclear protein that interacts with GTP-Gsp1p [Kazachstania saulgeensis]
MSKVTELYGGAITTVIPGGFLDASLVREIPDTQEVFVNSRKPGEDKDFNDGLAFNESIIVDLLQRVDAASDKDALDLHIKEIASLNQSDELRIAKYESLTDTIQSCICVEDAYKWGKLTEKETVAVCTALIRLGNIETDVVLTINVPVTKDQPEEFEVLEKGELPDRVLAAYKLVKEMATQFKIIDDSLFV